MNRVALLLSIAFALGVAAPPVSAATHANIKHPVNAEPQVDFGVAAAVRKILDEKLLDYPSSRFRSVYLDNIPGKRLLCGEINTKNRLGGYVGWSHFKVYVDKDEWAELEGSLVIENTSIPVGCTHVPSADASADYTSAITYQGH